VQNTFLKLITNWPGKLKHPKAWLFKVGRNMAINTLKKEKHFQPDSELDSKPDDSKDALSTLLSDEKVNAMWQAFERLKPEEQEFFRLHLQHDLTYSQIAEITGKRSGAIRVAIHRSREKLQQYVKESTLLDSTDSSTDKQGGTYETSL